MAVGSGTTSGLHRFLGGSPVAVLVKLVVMSLIVGAVMVGIGLTPSNLLRQFADAARSLFDLGFGAINDVGRYVLTGAIVVIPIWILTRIIDRR